MTNMRMKLNSFFFLLKIGKHACYLGSSFYNLQKKLCCENFVLQQKWCSPSFHSFVLQQHDCSIQQTFKWHDSLSIVTDRLVPNYPHYPHDSLSIVTDRLVPNYPLSLYIILIAVLVIILFQNEKCYTVRYEIGWI